MKRSQSARLLCHLLTGGLLAAASLKHGGAQQPSAKATRAFEAYARVAEDGMARQHQHRDSFLALAGTPGRRERLRMGEVVIEPLTPSAGGDLPGALLHDWRGTAFVPGGSVAGIEALLLNAGAYPRVFFPEVLRASLVAEGGGRQQASLRVRQRHGITVVMDIFSDVDAGRLDPQHGFSTWHSNRVVEIGASGTTGEHALAPGEEHGFLWRLDTYWSYEEGDAGLYVQVRSISLTRSIPRGLGWLMGPYVESIPQESLEFTLRSVCSALRNGGAKPNRP